MTCPLPNSNRGTMLVSAGLAVHCLLVTPGLKGASLRRWCVSRAGLLGVILSTSSQLDVASLPLGWQVMTSDGPSNGNGQSGPAGAFWYLLSNRSLQLCPQNLKVHLKNQLL